jgi:hypothetical protein
MIDRVAGGRQALMPLLRCPVWGQRKSAQRWTDPVQVTVWPTLGGIA